VVKAGQVSDAEAIQHLAGSPHWVWGAIDPVTKLLLTIDVGGRTLAMAQHVVHQVVQALAPDCGPLFITDGFKEYATAPLTYLGHWVQPSRRQAKGPLPKPRWMPQRALRYAQVVKPYRGRCLVRVSHRIVFGTLAGATHVLAPTGWHINTAYIEVRPVGRKEASASGQPARSRLPLQLGFHEGARPSLLGQE